MRRQAMQKGGRMGHHHHFAEHGRGGPHGGHGRHRARRGAVRQAVLLLLDEQPMHGYELITELERRSEGRWRPSPGAMYPALSRMEERGLIISEDVDGKRRFSLTTDGRARVAELRDVQGDDAAAPWDDAGGTGHRGDLRRGVAELVGQVRQIGRFGTPEQIERAGTVLATAKRSLYEILAAEPTEPDEPAAQPAEPTGPTEAASESVEPEGDDGESPLD